MKYSSTCNTSIRNYNDLSRKRGEKCRNNKNIIIFKLIHGCDFLTVVNTGITNLRRVRIADNYEDI